MNKVTPQQIEDLIVSEHFYTAFHGRQGAIEAGEYHGREKAQPDDADLQPLQKITHCTLILKGGYAVHGVNMGPVIHSNFDAQMGRDMARADAVNKIWPLLGYQLHLMQGGDWKFRLDNELSQLRERSARLAEGMHKAPINVQDDLAEQLGLMRATIDLLEKRRG